MKRGILTFIILLLVCSAGFSFDMKNIVAYPVPFNPRNGVLTVGYPASYSGASADQVKVVIYDINGDRVIEKNRSQLPLYWNGRNRSGRLVKPGMYIIKVTVENENGDYGKKIIRILINY